MSSAMSDFPIVQPDDHGIRPAGPPDACFYCKSKVGQAHDADCVVVMKKVRVRFTVDLVLHEPHANDKEQIEFHFNESSWCADNLVSMLERAKAEGCLCGRVKAELVEVLDETPRVVGAVD